MSAPRPPPSDVLLDQPLPSDVIDLLWVGEALLLVLIVAVFGAILFKIGSGVFGKVRTGEKIDFFPAPIPDQKLTLFVAPIFYRYKHARDGRKKFFRMLKTLPFISLFGALVFSGRPQSLTHYLIVYVIVFFAFGILQLFAGYVLRKNGRDVTFYHHGIGNRPKRRQSLYSSYEKAKVEVVEFEGSRFYTIRFYPRRDSWDTSECEYGLGQNRIGELVTFLRDRGLVVEEAVGKEGGNFEE